MCVWGVGGAEICICKRNLASKCLIDGLFKQNASHTKAAWHGATSPGLGGGGTQDKHKGDPRGESGRQGNTFLYRISGDWIPNLSFYFYSPYEEEVRSHNNDPPGPRTSPAHAGLDMCFFARLTRTLFCPKPAAVVLWVMRITLFPSCLPLFVFLCPPLPRFGPFLVRQPRAHLNALK